MCLGGSLSIPPFSLLFRQFQPRKTSENAFDQKRDTDNIFIFPPVALFMFNFIVHMHNDYTCIEGMLPYKCAVAREMQGKYTYFLGILLPWFIYPSFGKCEMGNLCSVAGLWADTCMSWTFLLIQSNSHSVPEPHLAIWYEYMSA